MFLAAFRTVIWIAKRSVVEIILVANLRRFRSATSVFRKLFVFLVAIPLTMTPANAQQDMTAHMGVEGNWQVTWEGVTEPDSPLSTRVSIFRPRETSCVEVETDHCQFSLTIPALSEWVAEEEDGDGNIRPVQNLSVDPNAVSASIQHFYFNLGRWGGDETIQQTGADTLIGEWSYGVSSGASTWTRIIPSFSKLQILDKTEPETMVSFQSNGLDQLVVNLQSNAENWADTQNFPHLRPSLRFWLEGSGLWGQHFVEIPASIGFQLSEVISEIDGNGVGYLEFTLTFWPGSQSGEYRLLVDGQEVSLTVNIEDQPSVFADLDLRFVRDQGAETRPIDTFNPDQSELVRQLRHWALVIDAKPGAEPPDEFRLQLRGTDFDAQEGLHPECNWNLNLKDDARLITCEDQWDGYSRPYTGSIGAGAIDTDAGLDLRVQSLEATVEGRKTDGIWFELDKAQSSWEFANCSISFHHEMDIIRADLFSAEHPRNDFLQDRFNWLSAIEDLPGKRLYPYQEPDHYAANTTFLYLDGDEIKFRDDIDGEFRYDYRFLRTLAGDLINSKMNLLEIDARWTCHEIVPLL